MSNLQKVIVLLFVKLNEKKKFYLVVCFLICCFCPCVIPYSLINFLSVYTQVYSHVFSCSMSNNPTCIPLFQELCKVKEKALRYSYHLDNYRFYTLDLFLRVCRSNLIQPLVPSPHLSGNIGTKFDTILPSALSMY